MNASCKNLITFLAILLSYHFAQAEPTHIPKPASNSAIKLNTVAMPAASATSNKRKIEATVSAIDEDDIVPDIFTSKTFDYRCELNDSLSIYTNVDDDLHAAIRWKNRLYRLKRVETTTGANRFENKKAGLVWISIPTKGMLLNSRLGQQLANECKTTGQ